MLRLLVISVIIFPAALLAQVEICDNGIDDDNDTLVDLNDDDCPCELIDAVSFIPNPSFEEMNCCPDSRSQLDCATDWIQASEPTTDFIHTCNWLGWEQFPPPRPFPDGEGIMGFRDGRVRNNNPEPYWKEYAGACLLSPLLKDSLYKFQFDVGFVNREVSPGINISFFGTADCQFLPFGVGDETFGCPTNSPNWQKLAQVRVDGGSGNSWVNTSLEITPDFDIAAIAIGPDCPPVSSPVSLYYFFDNLILNNFGAFDLRVSDENHPCSEQYSLSVPFNADFDYQWYLGGVALEGEIFSSLRNMYGEGNYQIRIADDGRCRLSTSFDYNIPVISEIERVVLCQGESYSFGEATLTESGFYLDTFPSANNCDSIVALEIETIGIEYDTVEVSIVEGNSYAYEGMSFSEPGEYPLTLDSSQNCDSLVLLRLANFGVYVPNTISLNSAGVDNVFKPFAAEGLLQQVEILIYDRWGNIIFSGEEWNGEGALPGVYTYLINLDFVEGESKVLVGSVTLLN